jgi:pre-mRNA-processing factor 8
MMAQHDELDGQAAFITIAFTPGSLSLSAYCLSPKGFEWARKADPNNPTGYNPATMSDRAQLLLTDRILGSTFAPVGGMWNYTIGLGAQFTQSMPYSVTLAGAPFGFWSAEHRPNHFASFIASAENDEIAADLDNNFA